MRIFECPNCKETMILEEAESNYKGEKYDKWCCLNCTHIIVLDYRGKENEM